MMMYQHTMIMVTWRQDAITDRRWGIVADPVESARGGRLGSSGLDRLHKEPQQLGRLHKETEQQVQQAKPSPHLPLATLPPILGMWTRCPAMCLVLSSTSNYVLCAMLCHRLSSPFFGKRTLSCMASFNLVPPYMNSCITPWGTYYQHGSTTLKWVGEPDSVLIHSEKGLRPCTPSANRTGLVQFYLCMSWGLLTSVFQFVGQAKKVQNTTQNYVLRGHWSAAPVVATVEFISSPLFEVCETKKQRRGLNPVFFTQCPGEWVRFFFRFKKASQGKFDQARFYLKDCVPLSKIAPEMNKYLYGFGHLDTFLCISKSISLFSDTGLSGSSVRTRRF